MSGSVTHLLRRWGAGDTVAESELYSQIYAELRRLAGHYMRNEAAGATLQPTALVHEVYVRLAGGKAAEWQDRGHLLALASRAMRRLLVDRARARHAAKRGGDFRHTTLAGDVAAEESNRAELLAVHEALERLEAIEPRQSQIVEMRYFAGFSFEETADALGISVRTAKRDWDLARLWLHREIQGVRG
jgi:RNA polymerase sigma factor (TIGR02999 family)